MGADDEDLVVEAASSDYHGGIPQVTSSFQPLPDTPVVDGFVVVSSQPSYVEIVAPADMPGGYQFSVHDVSGRHLIVVVPEGGVKQNETFKAAVLSNYDSGDLLSRGHSVPVGEWRDGTLNCCVHGCCHPQLCLTIWMTPLALGQILTRLRLDWLASPLPKSSSSSSTSSTSKDKINSSRSSNKQQEIWTAFRVLLLLFIGYQFLDTFFYYLTYDYIQGQYDPETKQVVYPEVVPAWASAMDALRDALTAAYLLLMLFITIRTRAAIRSRYAIPEKNCLGCEDLCCSLFCGGCTICQMARHTADYHKYRSSCCTETGLDYSSPQVV
ncbi:hypothetical protein ACA910_005843 [Epithemia clementina (nom. ined.)]